MVAPSHREWIWGAFLIRFTLGLLFFTAGLGKFIGGLGAFRGSIAKTFSETWLPSVFYVPFSHALPFAEVILGALILLGLVRFAALVLGSLLMVSLAFGMMVAGNPSIVQANIFYVGLFAAAFFIAPWDVICLDRLLFLKRGGD
ncbi:MAG: hypothetical protein M1457_12400 [bacterium]|nr:hypothetical protein [bacterium]